MIKYSISVIVVVIYSFSFTNILLAAENKILFKINNEIITTLDLLNEIRYLEIINKEFKNSKDNQSFEIAKKSLIREKIKEIELIKIIEEIKVDENILNNVLLKYFQKSNINTLSDFNNFFLSKKIDPNVVKKKVTIEILWNQLIFSKFKNNVKIDKELITKQLLNNNKQKEFLLSEILFNIDINENAKKKYNIIKKDIEEKSFSQAALIHSISDTANKGGKLGWISESSINSKIRDELNNLIPGEFTKPILVPGSFLILKIENLRETKKDLNLNKQIEITIKEKTNDQLNQFSNLYFNKVKKDIQIETF